MSKNHLGDETSAYLLQHKDNPVHWYAWGEEAFSIAKSQQKPVFLSVGYAACHWCHVMAHECFEDEEVADIMNAHFINIKIDREERPDIDKIYMSALHTMGEHGGWPLSMFLTPDGEPFWGGTYFPKKPNYGRPGFTSILLRISEVFQKEPKKIMASKQALIETLKPRKAGDRAHPQKIDIALVVEKLMPLMDEKKGGPKGAPKFPQAPLLEMFWCAYQKTRDHQYKHIVDTTLTQMSQGGIYDHLAGGYSRYSVDENWLVPHFEKMIYDNAQLIHLMCRYLTSDNKPLFRERIDETIGWLVHEMLAKGGGFYASLDADSEGEEGKFYVWDEAEIKRVLPSELTDSFVKAYDVDSCGNWEGKTILNRSHNSTLGNEQEEQNLAEARNILLAHREKRIRPGLDDKILTDWNGLLISALSISSVVLERDDYLTLARNCFDFIEKHCLIDESLAHSYAKGKSSHRAMLDDYANMIKAALSLFELTGEKRYLSSAVKWLDALNQGFWADEFGAYYMSSDQDALLIVRLISASDEATPNGNAVMIENLIRLYAYTGEIAHYEKAEKIIDAFRDDIAENIFAHSTYFIAQDFFLNYAEIIICAPPGDKIPAAIIKECITLDIPHKIIHQYTDIMPDKNHPAFGKTAVEGKITFYLCRNRSCSAPVTSISDLKKMI